MSLCIIKSFEGRTRSLDGRTLQKVIKSLTEISSNVVGVGPVHV